MGHNFSLNTREQRCTKTQKTKYNKKKNLPLVRLPKMVGSVDVTIVGIGISAKKKNTTTKIDFYYFHQILILIQLGNWVFFLSCLFLFLSYIILLKSYNILYHQA